MALAQMFVLLLLTMSMALARPLVNNSEELETPAEDRVLTAPYDINPYFGFRKYGELRYEPLTLPFLPGPPVAVGPANAPLSSQSSLPYSQEPQNYH